MAGLHQGDTLRRLSKEHLEGIVVHKHDPVQRPEIPVQRLAGIPGIATGHAEVLLHGAWCLRRSIKMDRNAMLPTVGHGLSLCHKGIVDAPGLPAACRSATV